MNELQLSSFISKVNRKDPDLISEQHAMRAIVDDMFKLTKFYHKKVLFSLYIGVLLPLFISFNTHHKTTTTIFTSISLLTMFGVSWLRNRIIMILYIILWYLINFCDDYWKIKLQYT